MPAIMPTYSRLPVTFSHGEGCYLVDTQGKRYLDGLCGISVTNLGHAHPAVTAAIQSQAASLLHTSNLYHIAAQEKLAETLTGVAGMDTCFFGNSGAEANEAAIKLARLYGHQSKVDKPAIVVLEGAFHGRTLATLSATGNRKIQAGFEPLVTGFIRAPRNDVQALRQIAAEGPKRHQLGLILDGDTPAPLGFAWEDILKDGKKVGDMTNCVWSYRMKANIGYALIGIDCQPGETVEIRRKGGSVMAKLVELPFL